MPPTTPPHISHNMILHGAGYPNPVGTVVTFLGDLPIGTTWHTLSPIDLPVPGDPAEVQVWEPYIAKVSLHWIFEANYTTTCGNGSADQSISWWYNHNGDTSHTNPQFAHQVSNGGVANFSPVTETCPTEADEDKVRKHYQVDMLNDPANTIFHIGTFLLFLKFSNWVKMSPAEDAVMTVTIYDWYIKYQHKNSSGIIGV